MCIQVCKCAPRLCYRPKPAARRVASPRVNEDSRRRADLSSREEPAPQLGFDSQLRGCGPRERPRSVASHRLLLRSPPGTTESLPFGPCPRDLSGTSPGPLPVPGEVWASHPLPNSHTAAAGPSERKAVPAPAPPRTTAKPQCPPAWPAAAPASPAAGSGREQVPGEKPPQSRLQPSRHRPPSCRSLGRRAPGGGDGQETRRRESWDRGGPEAGLCGG